MNKENLVAIDNNLQADRLLKLLYSRKLSKGENFRRSVRVTILRRKLSWNAKAERSVGVARPNFEEKTFVVASKTVKFVNVFSLESFALYGNVTIFPLFSMQLV